MLKQFKTALLISIPVVALVLLQTSCKKRDVYPSQQLPRLAEIKPTAAMVGDTVVLKGSNLKNVVDVKFGTTDVSKYTTANTDTSISVVVPDSLPPGNLYVQVYLDNGSGYASTQFKVLATPKVPAISSVSPTTAFPGDDLTIKGINFTNVSSVTFGSLTANYTIVDSTKLTVQVPKDVVGASQVITVSAPTGSDTVSFTVDFSPVITSFTPQQALAGDSITVSGIRFAGTTSVSLGSTAAGFVVYDDSTLKFEVPAGTAVREGDGRDAKRFRNKWIFFNNPCCGTCFPHI